jgi:protein-arginine kinase activator protein McsA
MPGQMPPGASKIFQFFGSLLSASEQSKVPETVGELLDNWEPDAESETERSCPGCGMSFEQFQELRRLGCSRCYETWAAELEQLFHTVHDAQQHVGKVPGRPSKAMASPLEVKQLKEKLEAAISEERFEEAALYRDKLRELLEGSGDAP